MLPVVARDVLGVGAAGLGYLTSAGAIGALVATTLIAGLGDYRNKTNLLMINAAITSITLILFAFSTWYGLSLLLTAILMGSLMAFETTLLTMVQLLTDTNMQGRVQGIYALVFGFTWLGGLVLGTVATISTVSIAIGAGGLAVGVMTLLLWQPLSRVSFVGR